MLVSSACVFSNGLSTSSTTKAISNTTLGLTLYFSSTNCSDCILSSAWNFKGSIHLFTCSINDIITNFPLRTKLTPKSLMLQLWPTHPSRQIYEIGASTRTRLIDRSKDDKRRQLEEDTIKWKSMNVWNEVLLCFLVGVSCKVEGVCWVLIDLN